jgi:capsular polysaccharide biosynthesis protein
MLDPLFTLIRNESRRIWCYRWLAAATTLTLWGGAAAYVLHLPNVYDAWGQIYVNGQTPLAATAEGMSLVGQGYGSPYVVQKTLLNDVNLEKVVRRMDPAAASMNRAALEMEMTRLRKRIHLARDPGEDFVELHVTDKDPVRARDMVRLLLDQFVARNVDRAQADLGRAGQFLDEQVASYAAMVAASQIKIAEFRRSHPAVSATMVDTGFQDARQAPAPVAKAAPAPRSFAASRRVSELESQLTVLRAAYTEQYPDVIATRRQLAEATRARDVEEVEALTTARPSPVLVGGYSPRRIMPAPVPPELASEWSNLQKNDEVLRNAYQQLLNKRVATRMSQAVYGADGVGKYQVTREPTVPTVPTGPHRVLYLALAGLVAVGGGLAAGWLRAAARSIFVSTQELEQAVQLPVIGTLSWEPAWSARPTRLARAPRRIRGSAPNPPFILKSYRTTWDYRP